MWAVGSKYDVACLKSKLTANTCSKSPLALLYINSLLPKTLVLTTYSSTFTPKTVNQQRHVCFFCSCSLLKTLNSDEMSLPLCLPLFEHLRQSRHDLPFSISAYAINDIPIHILSCLFWKEPKNPKTASSTITCCRARKLLNKYSSSLSSYLNSRSVLGTKTKISSAPGPCLLPSPAEVHRTPFKDGIETRLCCRSFWYASIPFSHLSY
jgi:hypothetical protein